MESPIGQIVGADPNGLARALKGQEWGMEIEGVMYDVEWTGATSGNGILLAKVKRKSRSRQQPTIRSPKE